MSNIYFQNIQVFSKPDFSHVIYKTATSLKPGILQKRLISKNVEQVDGFTS